MVLPTGTGPLSDTIFILGLRPFAKPVPASGTHISAPLIHAGGTKALMTVAELDKLRVALALHSPPPVGRLPSPASATPNDAVYGHLDRKGGSRD